MVFILRLTAPRPKEDNPMAGRALTRPAGLITGSQPGLEPVGEVPLGFLRIASFSQLCA